MLRYRVVFPRAKTCQDAPPSRLFRVHAMNLPILRPVSLAQLLALISLCSGLLMTMNAQGAEWLWSPVTNLSNTGQNARIPQVAGNASGNAMAVWSRYDGLNWRIQAAELNNTVWGKPVTLSAPGDNDEQPKVAMNGSGHARAVWIRTNGSLGSIQTAAYKNGVWSDPTPISLPGRDNKSPQIAMNETDTTAVVWTGYNGSNWVVQAKVYATGVFYDTTTLSYPLRDAFTPQVVVSQNGAITVAWSRLSAQTNTHLIETIRFQGGQWGEVNTVSSPTRDGKLPQLAVDAAGNLTVVWMEANGEQNQIISRRWLSASGWADRIALSPAAQNADTPTVAANGVNQATALWTQQRNGLWTLYSRQFNNGFWGDATIFANSGQNIFVPKVASDNSGSVTAVWMRSDGSNEIVLGSHFINGIWDRQTALSTRGQNAGLPQVAMVGDDNAVAVWLRNNGGNWIVQARQGTYYIPRYKLAVSKAGSGVVTSAPAGIDCGTTCNASFSENTQVTLTATPATDFTFKGWSGACQGATSCKLKMTGDKTVSARFIANADYLLNVTRSANGLVTSSPAGINCGEQNKSCKHPFGKDATVTLTAAPRAGYRFNGWSGCPKPDGNLCTITLLKVSTTVKPRFAALPKYVLQVSKTPYGRITSDPAGLNCRDTAKKCSAKFTSDTSVILTATPAANRNFTGWGDDCSGIAPTCSIIMDARKRISASFQ